MSAKEVAAKYGLGFVGFRIWWEHLPLAERTERVAKGNVKGQYREESER